MRTWKVESVQRQSNIQIQYTCCDEGKAFTVSTGVAAGGIAHITIGAHDCANPRVFMANSFMPGMQDGRWLGDRALLDDLLEDLGDLPDDAVALVQAVRSNIRSGYVQEMGGGASESAETMNWEPREHTPDMTQRPDYSSVDVVQRVPPAGNLWEHD